MLKFIGKNPAIGSVPVIVSRGMFGKEMGNVIKMSCIIESRFIKEVLHL